MNNFDTKDIVKKYNFKFNKNLGQNFLVDDTVLIDIVEGAEIGPEDYVIEIGPGVGTLTKELLKRAKHVYSIELDNNLIPILEEELKEFDNFTLIHKDAMKADLKEIIGDKVSVKLVANLPYYVTTPIITKVLNEDYNFKSLTVMIQKEVAERMNADPNSKEYASLTTLVKYYCDTKILRKVSPNCFIPRPKVESIVIRLDKLEKPRVDVKDKKLFFKIIRSSFNMRRKTLRNALKVLGLDKKIMEECFLESEIDPQRRGETLSLEEFCTLSNYIYNRL